MTNTAQVTEAQSKKAIVSAIEKVSNTQTRTNDDIQTILVACDAHARQFSGDVSLFQKLVESVKGADRKAMIEFINHKTVCKVEKGLFSLNKGRYKNTTHSADDLNAVKWYDYCKPVADLTRTLDPLELLGGIIKRLNDAIDEPIRETDEVKADGSAKVIRLNVVHPDMVKRLETMYTQLAIEQTTAEAKAA